MVSISASVNLPLHHKVQKFSSGTGSRGWSWKRGRKTVVVVVVLYFYTEQSSKWFKLREKCNDCFSFWGTSTQDPIVGGL